MAKKAKLMSSTAPVTTPFQVTVTATLGTFTEGAVLKDRKNIQEYFDTLAPKAKDSGVNDAKRWAAIVAYRDDDDGVDRELAIADALDRLVPEPVTPKISNIQAATQHDRNVALGARFGSDTKEFETLALAREAFEGSSLRIADIIPKHFADSETAEWPQPDTYPVGYAVKGEISKKALPSGSIYNSDYYYLEGDSGKTGSFYRDLYDGTNTGKRVLRTLELIDGIAKNEVDDDADKEYCELTGESEAPSADVQLQSARDRWSAWRTNGVNRLRLAQKFRMQCGAYDGLPNLRWFFVDDSDAKYSKRKPLFLVWTDPATGKPHQSKAISLQVFCSYKVDQARSKAGNAVDALKATVKRKPGAGRAGVVIPMRPTVPQVEMMFNAICGQLSDEPFCAQFLKWMRDAKDGMENIGILETLKYHLDTQFAIVESDYRKWKKVNKRPDVAA